MKGTGMYNYKDTNRWCTKHGKHDGISCPVCKFEGSDLGVLLLMTAKNQISKKQAK